jgi:hypothetical protein
MTMFEYYSEVIRSEISTKLLALSFWVMPEGTVKDALLISIENTLNKVIITFDKED